MTPITRLLLSFAALLWPLCIAAPALAHPAPYSHLDLTLADQSIDGTLVVHARAIADELGIDEEHMLFDHGVLQQQLPAIRAVLEPQLRLADGTGRRIGWQITAIAPDAGDTEALRLTLRASGPPPPELVVDANLFPADPAHHTFVNVHEDGEIVQQFLFDADSAPKSHFAGTSAGLAAVVATFVPSGIGHVLGGLDHVLFVLGLIMLGGTVRRLALIVTAFTLGHSLTLALAALNIFAPPAWLIEPLIALSIIVVGADNLLRGEGRDLRAGFALAFGLIHGFGFAFVLREAGLPQGHLAAALFAFNIGVELGQLLIVVPAALALAALRARWPVAGKRLAVGGSLAVILAGVYWFVDRVRNLGGA